MNTYFSDHDAVNQFVALMEILTLDCFCILNMSLYYKLVKIPLHYQFSLRQNTLGTSYYIMKEAKQYSHDIDKK